VARLPDAGPPNATQICLALWAGQQRLDELEELPLNAALNATQGVYCPAPTASQLAQLTQQTNALAASVLTLSPPDGGWPDGSGPSICDDPSTALSGLPSQIAESLAANRASWNAAAASACAAGMVESNDLLAYVYGDGGAFPGEAQTIGSTADGGGPCTQILQGNIVNGSSCLYPFECAAGLYCQSTGADASCGGICAPLVAAGDACGPLDQCAGTLDCTAGICGGPDAGPGPTQGAVGASCFTDSDCQTCLVCLSPVGGGLPSCATHGLAGAACSTDFDCGTPWLFCDPTSSTCAAAATFGQACTATTSSYACLDGWCDGTVCQPISGAGGACSSTVQSCLEGLYCMQPSLLSAGTCAPYPTQGSPCGLTQGLSYNCVGSNAYCDTDAGSCAALPGLGSPCAGGAECASGLYCESLDAGVVCAALQGAGDSCLSIPCQTGLNCNAARVCVVPLPGGAACAQGPDCLSGNCVVVVDAGVCESPCTGQLFGGCENQGLSFILGLGGALAWFDRRRRRHPPAKR
jgi:hypothetical protein